MHLSDPVVLNINFDSLGEAFGYPVGFRDPSYFRIFDRIADLAARFDLRLSLYVIGKDLKDPEIFDRVKDWAKAGHEVGNHSWSHPLNLGALPLAGAESEIKMAHDLVAECIGEAPVGFIAPNWDVSKRVTAVLVDLGYAYDTSLFPSLYLYPMIAKLLWNSRNNPAKLFKLLGRRDWLYPLTRPLEPHFVDRSYRRVEGPGKGRLLIIPLPAISRFSPPCWHTLGFLSGWDRLRKHLGRLLEKRRGFYYLMHPADFSAADDFDRSYHHILERMDVPLAEKMKRAEEVFDLIANCGRPVVTMREMAADYSSSVRSI